MNLSDAIDRYLDLRAAKCAKSTVRCDAGALRRLLADVGNIRVKDLTRDHLREHFYCRKGVINRVNGATFNDERARVKAFVEWAIDENLLTSNPIRGIDRRRVGQRERLRLTPTEMIDLIEACEHPRDRVLVSIACNTGLRSHALSTLKVGDVDLDNGFLRSYSSKTDNQKLHPITLDLDIELRRWFKHYQDECGPLQPDWYLAPARWRLGRVGPTGSFDGSISVLRPTEPVGRPLRAVHQALEAIGLDEKGAGFHTLRRSSGRAVFEAAVADGDPRAIHLAREHLDHSSVMLTESYIGTTHEKQKLNETLKGRAFLTKQSADTASVVVSLAEARRRRRGETS